MVQAKNLTPFQRKANYENWTEEDLTWVDPAVPPHLSFHDVDKMYMSGMLAALPKDIAGKVDVDLKEKLRYPAQPKYGKEKDLLPGLALKFKLKNAVQLQKVQRQLALLSRTGIDTRADHNSAIRAVMLQLKLAKNVKSEVLRHMIAAHMIEEYDFYYPRIEKYLKSNGLSFSAYVMYLYNGNIWADEYMLGALGKMFHIKISVVSPAYDDIWDIFHRSAFPNIVLISNGGDFGRKHGATHFSATKGMEREWKCVGADDNIGEMGLRTGYQAGLDRTVDHFYVKEKAKLLKQVRKTSGNVEQLCHDLSNLCIRREKIYDEVQKLGIKVESFKQLGKFYYDPPQCTEETIDKTSVKQKQSKHHKSQKSKTAPRSCGKFSQEVSTNILSETVAEIDKGLDIENLPDQSAVAEILNSRPRRCRVKNARPPKFPSLPENRDVIDLEDEQSETVTTVKELKQWQISTQIQRPYNLQVSETVTRTEPGVVEERAISPEAAVITEQPQATQDDIFPTKRPAEEKSESESKKQRVDSKEDRIFYGGLPMSRQMVQILEQQRIESEMQAEEHERMRTESVQAEVHRSCKTTAVLTEHAYSDTVQNMFTDVTPPVPELDQSKISVGGKVDVDTTLWEDAKFDDQENIIGFESQPNLNVFIPRSVITEALEHGGSKQGTQIVDKTQEGQNVIPAAGEELTVTTEKDNNVQEKVEVDTIPAVHKQTQQSSLRIFFPASGSSQRQKDVRVKRKQKIVDVTGAQSDVTEPAVKSKAEEKSQKSTSGKTCGTQRRSGDDVTGAQDIKSVSTAKEMEKIIVSVPQNLDTSRLPPPVPEGERLSHLCYCERCSFTTTNKKYLKKHNTRMCLALTVVERLKCPEEGCEDLFIHENNYRDHINKHRGIYSYQCAKCGKYFMLQNQLARHKKSC